MGTTHYKNNAEQQPGNARGTRYAKFRRLVHRLLSGEITDTTFVVAAKPIFHHIARKHLKNWTRWHHPIDEEDIVQHLSLEALIRLGRVQDTCGRAWNPEHPSSMKADAYVITSLERAAENMPRRALKYRGPGEIFIAYPEGDTRKLEHMDPMYTTTRPEISETVPVAKVVGGLAIQRPGAKIRCTDAEIAALEAIGYAVRAGTPLAAIPDAADIYPHKFGGLNGERVTRLVNRVCRSERRRAKLLPSDQLSESVDPDTADDFDVPVTNTMALVRRGSDVSDSVPRFWRRRVYDPHMQQDKSNKKLETSSPEQDQILALVPVTDREMAEVVGLAQIETIESLRRLVTGLYDNYVTSTLPLARALFYVQTLRLWAIDAEYASFDEFISGSLATQVGRQRSSIFAMSRAYGIVFRIAEDTGHSVQELWSRLGPYKIGILGDLDPKEVEILLAAALAGATRAQLKAAKTALLSDGADTVVETGDGAAVIADLDSEQFGEPDPTDSEWGAEDAEFETLEARPGPEFADGPADITFDDDDDDQTQITLHGRVPDGVAIRLRPLDKEAQHDSLAGMPISQAASRVYFRHKLPGVWLQFGLETRGDKIVSGVLQFDSASKK